MYIILGLAALWMLCTQAKPVTGSYEYPMKISRITVAGSDLSVQGGISSAPPHPHLMFLKVKDTLIVVFAVFISNSTTQFYYSNSTTTTVSAGLI